MSYRGMMDGWHGDEPEIEANARYLRDCYKEEHADDWKYEFIEEDDE